MTTTNTAPSSSTALMSADEFAARYANVRVELVKGIVKELPMPGFKHGMICLTIGRLIGNHVEAHDLGRVASNDSWIKTGTHPDTARGLDVCFFSYTRMPKGEVPEGIVSVAPDLVVEIRSPSDRWSDLFTKVGEYLGVGVGVVLIIDPVTVTASVYRDEEFQQIFDNGDTLTLPDVLPGFSVPVARLFS